MRGLYSFIWWTLSRNILWLVFLSLPLLLPHLRYLPSKLGSRECYFLVNRRAPMSSALLFSSVEAGKARDVEILKRGPVFFSVSCNPHIKLCQHLRERSFPSGSWVPLLTGCAGKGYGSEPSTGCMWLLHHSSYICQWSNCGQTCRDVLYLKHNGWQRNLELCHGLVCM